MKQTTPFSTTWTYRLFGRDFIFGIINLKHMEDTAEGGHPEYVKGDDLEFGIRIEKDSK